MDGNDFRGLWQDLIPDRVNTTYRSQVSLGSYSSGTAVTNCWWRASGGTIEGAPSDGVYVRDQRKWYFPKSVTSVVPAIGDLLVNPVSSIDPAAVTWTILGVNDVGALGAWELTCISLQLAANLRGAATFSRPDNTRDSAGRPAPNYSAYASAVPARFQPQGGDATEVYDRITMPKRFSIYTAYFVDVRAKDQVSDGTSTYTVVSSSKPQQLSEIQEVVAELIL